MDFLEWEEELPSDLPDIEELSEQDIAIIGLSAELPLVPDLESFWTFVSHGVDFVSAFPASRRPDADPFLRQRQATHPDVGYMDGAYLEEIDKFDHAFFRVSPKEAGLMTPNQRLLLETTWKAVEDAGYGGGRLAGSKTGVFIGFNNDALMDYKRMISDLDPSLLSLAVPGNLTSVLAGRISYVMDWHGPSVCIDTACSSSLVALHQACQAIRNRECELAAVGSVKINLLPLDDIRIGIESSDWRARTFDDSSDGTGGGEGVIAFLLKPAAQAMADGDLIYAVIRGSAVNQDGNSIGITAPNVLAQEEVLSSAWRHAGIDPATLGYLEAHGTGTKLGDPVEIDAIRRAFGRYGDTRQAVAIGSIKSNIGHLDHAAGLMGTLKAVLALRHKQLPPTLHFARPNRNIDFIGSPVYINDELRDWETDGHPRRCGVSAFGMSGTNCHVVLEEAPEAPLPAPPRAGSHLLVLSAKSESSLLALTAQYAKWPLTEEQLSDACYTALTGRGHYSYRLAMVFDNLAQLKSRLEGIAEQGLSTDEANGIYFGRHKSLPDRVEEEAQRWGERARLLMTQLHQSKRWEEAPLRGLAELYAAGAALEGHRLYAGEGRRKVRLPTYAFERTRCWLDTDQVRQQTPLAASRIPAGQEGATKKEVSLTGRHSEVYSATEQVLARIWGDQLGIGQLKVDDTYYELGGDSILALKIVNRIRSELRADIAVDRLLRNTSIALLAEWIDREAGTPVSADPAMPTAGLPVAAPQDSYPLTPSQQRVFIQQQLATIQTSHNAPFCVLAEGTLDYGQAEAALAALIDRHEPFRTAYDYAEGSPVQRIITRVDFRLQTWDATEDEALSIVQQFIRPFDLKAPPLLRAGIIRLAQDRHLIVLDMHHISTDGVTNSIVITEFCQLYAGQSLAARRLQYKDYAVWLQAQLSGGGWQAREAYWSTQLAAPLPLLQLPADRARPDRQSFNGQSLRFSPDRKLTGQLRALARREGTTLHALLFALYALLLHQWSKQDELIVGTLVSGRNHPDVADMAGMFINFLPIRLKIDSRSKFRDYLNTTHQRVLDAYAHDYPFDQMLMALAPTAATVTERGRNPVYDTMFVFHNEFKMNALADLPAMPDGLRFASYPLPQVTAALDLKLDVWEQGEDELAFVLNYSTDLFRELTMLRFQRQLLQLMQAAVDDSTLALDELAHRTQDGQPLPQVAEGQRPVKIAISASFTAEPAGEYIAWWCKQFQVDADVVFAPYHQVFQQLLDGSSLIGSNRDANVLFIRFEDWLRDEEDALTDDQLVDKLEATYEELIGAIRQAPKRGVWLVGLFPATLQYGTEIQGYLSHLNIRFQRSLAALPQIRVLDCRHLASLYQLPAVFDPVKDREGHLPFTDEYYAALGTVVARAIVSWKKPGFKVVVLDCDHTLWQGICGEAGVLGVTPYVAMQQQMIACHDRGMLLALCSKNNEADVWEVFDRHPQMLLKREHLVGWQLNWEPKSVNIRRLAEQLNLGLDQFLFLDDSAFECAEMRQHCPEVLTLQLPADAAQQAMLLKHVWAFDRFTPVTEADLQRTAMYQAEQRRKALQSEAGPAAPLADFLKQLQLQLRMTALEPLSLPRAAQLTMRTNQFNMNGIQRTEEEIAAMSAGAETPVWTVEVRDRFGDYGMVGLIMGRVAQEILHLDSFMLSCRVLGRRVEHAILSVLRKYCEEHGLSGIQADYRRTAKNEPFRLFLEEAGWMRDAQGEGAVYTLETAVIPAGVEGITVFEASWPAADAVAGSHATAHSRQAREQGQEVSLQLAASLETPFRLVVDDEAGRPFLTGADMEVELPEQSGEQLLHQAYLLPLRYYRGDLLLSLPVREVRRADSQGGGIPDRDLQRASYEPPVSGIAVRLAEVWSTLLAVQPVGLRDHFFALGGNSLQAASLASRIYQQFQVQLTLSDLFQSPVLADMAERIGLLAGTDQAAAYPAVIPSAALQDAYPVSSAQLRLLILHRMDPSSTSYNMPLALSVQGQLDLPRLAFALQALIGRHESLRTTFHWTDEQPVQRIAEEPTFKLEQEKVPAAGILAAVMRFVRPFDLETAPLLRARLLEVEEENAILLLDMHHLISDGISLALMAKEWVALYEGETLPALRLQYKDYAVWQAQQRDTPQTRSAEAFWLADFQGEIPRLEWTTDRPRSGIAEFKGARHAVPVEPALREALERLARSTDSTVYMVLLSAFSMLLSVYSGQEDVVIGTPAGGRQHADLEPIVGMFVNTLALRLHPVRSKTFADYLAEVRAYTLSAFEKQAYPFEALVDKLGVQRDLTRNPLFDAFFVVQNMDLAIRQGAGLRIEPYPLPLFQNRFDLTLEVTDQPSRFSFQFEYNAALFDSQTVARMGTHYVQLLQTILLHPSLRLAEIDLLPDEEKAQLLAFGVPMRVPFADDRTLHGQFEQQAAAYPDRTAVVFGHESLTYGELNGRANQIAHVLRDRGIEAGAVVGLMLDRSTDMIAGLLGILKAGGVYLPIDPAYPRDRKAYMLADSGSRLVLTQAAFLSDMAYAGEWVDLSAPTLTDESRDNLEPLPHVQPSDLAYIIYTSGSTGQPKGVMIEHRGVLNLRTFFERTLQVTPEDRVVQFASLSFDASVWEIAMALLTGASLVLVASEDYMNYARFEKFLTESGVTVATLPPNYAVHLRPEKLTNMRVVVTAGSAATSGLVDKWKPYVRYFNAYGPTETTVCATIWEAEAGSSMAAPASVSIGQPITNTDIYILDADRKLLPIGVSGEICIGGAGVGRGYLNREALTQERFVPHPFQPNGRIYRTGDLGRWLADGSIEYLGRMDEQVKIRGFRVELGEIEAALLQQDDIRDAVVLSRKDSADEAYLCAYYTAEQEIAAATLRQALTARLPAYMMPAAFVWLKAFPVTPSGKVDRKALPEPPQRPRSALVEPRTQAEQELVQLWASILQGEAVGVTDSFFEIGGDSLKAALLLTRIQQRWQVELSLADIFRSPTVEQLALALEWAAHAVPVVIPAAVTAEAYPLSSGQTRLFVRQQLDEEDVSYNMPGIFHVQGPLDRERLEQAISEIVSRHESLRTTFGMEEGAFVQRIGSAAAAFTVEQLSVGAGDEADLIRTFIRPFKLDRLPLLRAGVWQRSEMEVLLLFDLHHIVSDGVSIRNLVFELKQLYEGGTLPALPIQYKDYAVWQQRELSTARMQKQARYWQTQLADYVQGPPLPTDFPRQTHAPSTAGSRVLRSLGASFMEKLHALGQETNTTLYMILSAAYQALVAAHTGRTDVAVGSHVAGRAQPETNALIGMFVNTVVLRAQPEGRTAIAAYLAAARETIIDSLDHADYPFDLLAQKHAVAGGDPNRNPLFDALFILQSVRVDALSLGDLSVTAYPYGHPCAKFDWTLEALERPDQGSLELSLEYKTDLFRSSTAERLLEDYLLILAYMADHPTKTLGDIPLENRIPARRSDRIAKVEFHF